MVILARQCNTLDEGMVMFRMVANEYKYKTVRSDQLRDRQQQVNQIAHVLASANLDDVLTTSCDFCQIKQRRNLFYLLLRHLIEKLQSIKK